MHSWNIQGSASSCNAWCWQGTAVPLACCRASLSGQNCSGLRLNAIPARLCGNLAISSIEMNDTSYVCIHMYTAVYAYVYIYICLYLHTYVMGLRTMRETCRRNRQRWVEQATSQSALISPELMNEERLRVHMSCSLAILFDVGMEAFEHPCSPASVFCLVQICPKNRRLVSHGTTPTAKIRILQGCLRCPICQPETVCPPETVPAMWQIREVATKANRYFLLNLWTLPFGPSFQASGFCENPMQIQACTGHAECLLFAAFCDSKGNVWHCAH